MSRSNNNILNLPSLPPDFDFIEGIVQVVAGNDNRVIHDVHSISRHTLQQKFVIDSIAGKARHGIRRLMDLDRYAGEVFGETVTAILTSNDQGKGSPYEPYQAAFNDRLAKVAARHVYGLLEIGAMSIAREVMRSPDMKRSLLEKLLG